MKKDKRPRLADIIPDKKYRKEIEKGLLEGKSWLDPEGVFSTLLQSVVDASRNGCLLFKKYLPFLEVSKKFT